MPQRQFPGERRRGKHRGVIPRQVFHKEFPDFFVCPRQINMTAPNPLVIRLLFYQGYRLGVMDKNNIKRGVHLSDIFIACLPKDIKIIIAYFLLPAVQGVMEFLGYGKETLSSLYNIPSGIHG